MRRREEPIGDVDGYALLALGFETVDQQGEIDVVAGRSMLSGIALERGKLILENLPGVGKQASDQRRLAVVDRTAGQEAQKRFLLLPGQIGTDVLGRQPVLATT